MEKQANHRGSMAEASLVMREVYYRVKPSDEAITPRSGSLLHTTDMERASKATISKVLVDSTWKCSLTYTMILGYKIVDSNAGFFFLNAKLLIKAQ